MSLVTDEARVFRQVLFFTLPLAAALLWLLFVAVDSSAHYTLFHPSLHANASKGTDSTSTSTNRRLLAGTVLATAGFSAFAWLCRVKQLRWSGAAALSPRINKVYGLLSGGMVLLVLRAAGGVHAVATTSLCEALPPPQPSVAFGLDALTLVFFASKFWEFTDVVLVSLMGVPISAHFCFHHATTPSLGLVVLLSRSRWGLVFTILNLMQHAVLYPHLGGWGTAATALYCRVMGHIQLLASVAAIAYTASSRWLGWHTTCGGTATSYGAELWAAWLLCCYFRLLRHDEQKRPDKDAARGKAD